LYTLLQLTGCTLASVGENADAARLPTGVTLLKSNDEKCAGTVQLDDESRSGRSGGPALLVREGENATLRVNDDIAGWTCVGDSSAQRESIECPQDTTHLRITRSAIGEDFLLECYG
jgi:hypothetical protein